MTSTNHRLPPAYRLDAADRTSVAPSSPRCLFLEVTNRCNLRCRTCVRTIGPLEPLHTLSWSNYSACPARILTMNN